MRYRISEYDGQDCRATVAGEIELGDISVKSIVDAVSQINSGQNADEFCTGYDPYSGELLNVVDGFLVMMTNSEGDLYAIHAKEIDD